MESPEKLYAPDPLAVVLALAAPLSVTVAPLPPVIVPEMVHVGCTIVTVLPAAEVVNAELSRAAADPLVSETTDDVLVVDPESVSATDARTPFEIEEEFTPQITQVEVPLPLLHDTCLPAAVAAAPTVTLADVKSTVE